MTRTAWIRTRSPRPKPRHRKDAGFSREVKLAVRTRAGNGDPDNARCEATGVWLGRHGGEVQHRAARLSGGRGAKAPWWFHTPANAALLSCEAHRLAESRDREMGPDGQGFWLRSTQDASAEPIMLHDEGGGTTVWLGADGTYWLSPPERGAA
jgi:hypothetical protein